MDSLPADLVRWCLGALADPADLLSAAQVSHAFAREANSDALWEAMYFRRWPRWTLLVPEDTARPNSAAIPGLDAATAARMGVPGPSTSAGLSSLSRKELYRLRSSGRLRLTVSTASVCALRGTATNDWQPAPTTMPLEVVMCKAPRTRLSTMLQIGGRVIAQASYGATSSPESDEPAVKSWLGSRELPVVAANAPGAPAALLQWREHSGPFGHWVYEGRVSSDGKHVSGSYHLSILSMRRGRFTLTACDPATHVGGALGGLPTPNQLTKRVAVKWASSALQKAAREALLDK